MSRRPVAGGSRRRASGPVRTPVARRLSINAAPASVVPCRPTRPVLVLVTLLLVTALGGPRVVAPLAAQEIITGGEVRLLPSLTLSPLLDERIVPNLRTEYSPIVSVYGPDAELTAAFTLWHETPVSGDPDRQTTGAELDEVRLTLYPSDALVVDLGRFAYQPGRALLVSPNNSYTTLAFADLIRGELAGATEPNTLARARLFVGSFYFVLAFVPVPNVPQLVEPGSIWAPKLPVDETIDDPLLSPDPVTLGDVFIERTRAVPEHYRRVSGGLEAGTTVGAVDLALHYYHGVDPAPVPRARVDFPLVPPETYDLILAPDEAVIDSFGLVAETLLSDITLWFDASFVPNKTLTTTNVDPYSKRTILVTAPTLNGVAGASLRLDELDLLLLAEYYHTYPFLPSEVPAADVIKPTLSSHLAGSVRLGFGWESPWSASAGTVVDLAGPSAAITAQIELAPSDTLAFSFAAPVFLGSPETGFGQYREIVQLTASARYRF